MAEKTAGMNVSGRTKKSPQGCSERTRLFGEDDDGDMDVPDSLAWVRELFQRQVNRHANMEIEAGFDASWVGIQGPTSWDIEVESGWSTLQAKLVRHFKIATDRREVSWLF
jgi:hypothetical protein